MDNYNEFTFTCPDCGRKVKAKVRDMFTEEDKDLILSKKAFRVKCRCGGSGYISFETTYINEKEDYAVMLGEYGSTSGNIYQMLKDCGEQLKGVNLIGTSCLEDFITAIVSHDEGLDYRVVKLVLHDLFMRFSDDKFGKKDAVMGLTPRKGKEQLRYHVTFFGTAEQDLGTFPMETYQEFYKKYIDRLDKVKIPTFDSDSCETFLREMDKDFDYYETHKKLVYTVQGETGELIACRGEDNVDCKLNDNVAIVEKEMKGNVVFIHEINELSLERDYDELPLIKPYL